MGNKAVVWQFVCAKSQPVRTSVRFNRPLSTRLNDGRLRRLRRHRVTEEKCGTKETNDVVVNRSVIEGTACGAANA